ncbi:hypothetical protein TBK1r_76510 [Stieleria magnilauensis]|uniref:Uncharacterized protein n=1 Tax=Stieleria magnilauensis TaxID=2527963 RepID=A0ABX5Y3N6_9BACT|nr:hypothetical protein TBK1r_76510 [Planctomycetes bacterium TBK1r]
MLEPVTLATALAASSGNGEIVALSSYEKPPDRVNRVPTPGPRERIKDVSTTMLRCVDNDAQGGECPKSLAVTDFKTARL